MKVTDFGAEFLQFLVLLPASILCFLPMRNQLKLSTARTFTLLISVLAVIIPVSAILTISLDVHPNIIFFPLFFVFFLIYYHMVRSGLGETLAIFLQMIALFSFPADFVLAYDAKIHPQETLSDICIESALFQLLLSLIFALAFGYVLYRFESSLIDRLSRSRIWYVTLPIPLCFLLLNVMIQPVSYTTLYTGRLFFLYLFLLCISLFLFLLTYVIFYFVAIELLNAAKTEEHVRLLEMQEHQYLAQQAYMKESQRIRHDFRQSLFTLAQLADNGEIETLQSYLHTCVDTLPQSETITYCQNLSVNALLNYYATLMREHQIRMQWKICLPDDCAIPDNDLCGMLGNLLENILHGCSTITDNDRYCCLSIQPRHNSLYIVASNNFKTPVKPKGDSYQSTHRGGHGIGLSSIRATAERYGGMAKFSHCENEFHTDIVICI